MTRFHSHEIEDLFRLPGVPLDFFSEAWAISSDGQMIVGTAGERQDPGTNPLGGRFHGFKQRKYLSWWLRDQVDFPNAVATSARGCNDQRDVVGFFKDANDQLHGFIWLNGETPAPFDISDAVFPSVFQVPGVHNAVLGINNDRWVVGVYRKGGRDLGFVAQANNRASFLSIDMSVFVVGDGVIKRTSVNAINSKGELVGSYVDDAKSHAFTASVEFVNNKFQLRKNPEPLMKLFLDNVETINVTASGLNDSGVIVGNDNADNASARTRGFELISGQFAPIDVVPEQPLQTLVPGKDDPLKTLVSGIDSHGTVVGAYRAKRFGNLFPTRHAYVGFFADAVVPWAVTGTVRSDRTFPSAPPPTMVPWPYPLWPSPVSRTFETTQNAVIGLVISELVSSVTQVEARQQLRAAALDLVLYEVRQLMKG